jgi:hypothetical protein
MRQLILIPITLGLLSFKPSATVKPGTYCFSENVEVVGNWIGKEERTLVINADSSFTYFIHYANSDFPGDFKGHWSIAGDKLLLTDKHYGMDIEILLTIKSDSELIGTEHKTSHTLLLTTK